MEYATEITDAPPVFHKYSSLAVAAGALGNRVYFRFGDILMRPNLWICLIAPSSVGRKTTSLNIAKRIFASILPGRVMPEEFTGESLIPTLAASPQAMFFASEFVSLVTCIKKGYNDGLMGILADLYDSPEAYNRSLRSGSYEIRDAAPSMLAATTVEWFLHKLTPEDWSGGFVPRFLLVPQIEVARDLIALPPPADETKKRRLIAHLDTLRRVNGEMRFTPHAETVYRSWYSGHVRRRDLPEAFSSTYHRMAVQAIKLAMIYRCIREPETVNGEVEIDEIDVRQAMADIDQLCTDLVHLQRDNLAFTPQEKKRQKILSTLRGKGGSLDHSPLLRASGLDGAEFRRVMQTLVEAEEIRVEWHRDGKKPRATYHIT